LINFTFDRTHSGRAASRALCELSERHVRVLPKIRELIAELQAVGFVAGAAAETASKPVTISGAVGDDAKHYQVRSVQLAIEESKK
jgi:hypothetical protein